jgi:hypothetical protein
MLTTEAQVKKLLKNHKQINSDVTTTVIAQVYWIKKKQK